MVSIPTPAQALLGTDAVAHVWTRNRDGTPQISVVWVIAQGDEILFGTSAASQKAKNLARDPAIILSIEDIERNERGFQRHLVIRGTATLETGPDRALLARMARNYTGLERHPLAAGNAADCVMVRVAIDRISGVGPWVGTEPAVESDGPGR